MNKKEEMTEIGKVEVQQKTSAYNLETWAKELERSEYIQWSSDSLAMQQEAAKSFSDRMKRVAGEIRDRIKLYYGD